MGHHLSGCMSSLALGTCWEPRNGSGSGPTCHHPLRPTVGLIPAVLDSAVLEILVPKGNSCQGTQPGSIELKLIPVTRYQLVRKGIAITSRRNHSYFYRVGTGRRGTCGAGDPLSTSWYPFAPLRLWSHTRHNSGCNPRCFLPIPLSLPLLQVSDTIVVWRLWMPSWAPCPLSSMGTFSRHLMHVLPCLGIFFSENLN